jgi:hypothetical protein
MDLATRVNRIDEHLAEVSGALAQLAAAQARTEERVAELATAQRDLAAAQRDLAAAQARTEERVGELAQAQARAEAQIERLAEAQVQTEKQLGALRAWQTGESRRREGEQYERQVVRRAATIFGGGDGGSPEDAAIRRRIMAALDRIPGETFRRAISPRGKFDELPAENDPFLADLVWWKGEHVAVAEVSIVVDNNDVFRAQARADTLRRAGSDALPVVIGQSWSDLGSLGLAQQLRVAYWVDRDLSDSFIEFRQLENGPPA